MNTVTIHSRHDLSASKYALEKLSAQLSEERGSRCDIVDMKIKCDRFETYSGPCEIKEYYVVVTAEGTTRYIFGPKAESLYHEYEWLCKEYDSPTLVAVPFHSLL